MNQEQKRNIQMLDRRRKYLVDKIRKNPHDKEGAGAFDRSELRALNWAISVLATADKQGVLVDLQRESLLTGAQS